MLKKLISWQWVPITSWSREGEKIDAMTFFWGGGSKITVDSDYSHEVKRHFLLGRKAMTNLKSIKSRDIILTTKIHIVKVTFFPIVTYSCESWTIKKAEH